MNAALFILLAVAVGMCLLVYFAPRGHEDADGFHFDTPRSVMTTSDGLAHVCSWCERGNDGTKWATLHGLNTTHGICPACSVKHFSQPIPNE